MSVVEFRVDKTEKKPILFDLKVFVYTFFTIRKEIVFFLKKKLFLLFRFWPRSVMCF